MALTRSSSGLDVVFEACRTFFNQRLDTMRKAQDKRRVYRATCYELSVLSDRDLTDLGIPRSNIKKLALEAVYGS